MAIREGTTVSLLVSEAITYWILYLAKIAKSEAEEAEEKDTAALDQEIKEAEELLYDIRVQRCLALLKRERADREKYAQKSRLAWARMYPGRPWPGAPGWKRKKPKV